MSRQLWMQYVMALLAWAFAVLLTAVLLWAVCRNFRWSFPQALYGQLSQNAVFLSLMATGAGWLVLSYRFLARPMRYLNAMIDAAQALAHPTDKPITLPAALDPV